MARIDTFLRLVVEQLASDLHFHSGNVPLIRYQGNLLPMPFRVLSELETRRFLWEILDKDQQEELVSEQELDFVYILEDVGRFRVNVFYQNHGLGAVFRVIPNELPKLEDLLFPPGIQKLLRYDNGLILVTGPTGSGKTTTLASIINEFNRTRQRHIITVEDPIEFVHPTNRCVVTQRQVGSHTKSFAHALRASLREAPDILVLGEMRDADTIQLALKAAETGILVFGTLHTNSATKAINRILDATPVDSREQARGVLSSLLRGVVAQRLCKRCDIEGRVALVEILTNSYAVASMIRTNKVYQLESYLKTMNPDETGMQSMDRCIRQYIKEGVIEFEEGKKYADDPMAIEEWALSGEEF